MIIPENVQEIMQKIIDNKGECYAVGGCCRSHLMEEPPKDYDLFCNLSGKELLNIFPEGKVIGGPERQEKILTVLVGRVEISQYRSSGDRTETGTSLEEHLSTSDLTLNSMAVGLDGSILDLHGGQQDIKDKLIRAVGNPNDRLIEDKLRAFRAIRFQSQYNAKLDMSLEEEIIKLDISDIPKERINDELKKILQYEEGLENLMKVKLLEKIMPEIITLHTDGGDKHRETIIAHSLAAYRYANMLTDNIFLKLATFLHDIGKGFIKKNQKNFSGHDIIGMKIASRIFARLKFSKSETKYMITLIEKHMFGYALSHRKAKWAKLFKDLEDNGVVPEDLAILNYCDNQSNFRNPRTKFHQYLCFTSILEMYWKMKYEKEPFRKGDMEINGRDILSLGVEAGPKVGEILQRIFDEIMEGRIANVRPELLYFAKSITEKE